MEQETSCPICRASLGEPPGVQNPVDGMMGNPEGIPIPPLPVGANAPQPRIIRRPLNTTNHFFHFDGIYHSLACSCTYFESCISNEFNYNLIRHTESGTQIQSYLCVSASRYISWLPSFSVEVTHIQFNGLRNVQPTTGNLVQTSQLDNMVGCTILSVKCSS